MDRLVPITDSPITYSLKTYGCKVNTYDSGLLENRFATKGLVEGATRPRVHVLNTCAVTAEATREAVREVRRLKRRDPESIVVVTGCAAQVDRQVFEDLPEADLVIANSHKGQLEDLIHQKVEGRLADRVFHSNIFRKEDLEAGGGREREHTRSFLKIQDGCNSFCTYCVIPFARGKSRSVAIPDLVERVNQLYAEGAREVVLTGVHIGDFEDQQSLGKQGVLEDLIENLLIFTKMPRFRLSSLEPVEVTDRLLDLYRDSRLCPHFHMSIQSANTKVLGEMKRHYSALAVEQSLRAIAERVPGAFVGMDVIVGFPGETEEEFSDTYVRLSQLPWTRIHVFPYSQRPGTKAACRNDQVRNHEIHRRSDRLKLLSIERLQSEALKQMGSVKSCMVLNQPSKGAQTLSADYWPVRIVDDAGEAIRSDQLPMPGEEILIRITGIYQNTNSAHDRILLGVPAIRPESEQ